MAIASGCARPVQPVGLAAPNPNGCYAVIFDEPDFRGRADVINGPGRWSNLDRIRRTSSASWRDRIRSLRVGEAAAITVYVETGFAGRSDHFEAGSTRARLDADLSGQIESLEITCRV